MKLLVVYQKLGPHRFIGHLDLQRAMQRALRRAGLPVCYSQGFNPHLLLSFAAPLSVGVAGACEVMELPLAQPMAAETCLQKLNAVLPEGLKAVACRLQEDSVSPAMARLAAALYRFEPAEEVDALVQAIPALLAQTSLPYLKKTKSGEKMADLRPLIYNLREKDGHIEALLAVGQAGGARPDQLFAALCQQAGVPEPRCLVTRLSLLDERMVPLEDA